MEKIIKLIAEELNSTYIPHASIAIDNIVEIINAGNPIVLICIENPNLTSAE